MKQLILILVLIGSIGIANAYNSEVGLNENESIHANYDLWMQGFQWYAQTSDGIYIYKPDSSQSSVYQVTGVLSWVGWTFTSLLDDDTDIPITWTLQGKTWDEDTSTYENKGTEYVTGYVMEVSEGSETTKTVKKNTIVEYFTNDSSRAENFVGTDTKPDHPDYVEVVMIVGNGMIDIEHTEEYGITMTGDEAVVCSDHGTDIDYGFGTGRGGEGGTSGIYDRVSVDDVTETNKTFNILFYAIIPLIFFMLGFKLIIKIVGTYGGK